jgi:L-cysteine:1D-myo-inositol 2-amino-2-deoxy-alpha-D-glucopyranoside ligase
VAPTKPIIQEMVNALADDLDAPRVLRALEQWCSETESGSHGGEAGELARALDLYLGIAI